MLALCALELKPEGFLQRVAHGGEGIQFDSFDAGEGVSSVRRQKERDIFRRCERSGV
jgi:hypothetical protein